MSAPSRNAPGARPQRGSAAPRRAALALAAVALLTGVLGGLLRGGVTLPEVLTRLGAAGVLPHAMLMIGAFFGTVIATERAVALRARWAALAPFVSALAGAALLAGRPALGAWLLLAASLAFVAVSLAIVRRQRAAHTVLLLVAAACWLGANLGAIAGAGLPAVLAAGFAFLVVTIAAERLEMTRLMRRHAAAQPLLFAIVALLALAPLLAAAAPSAGEALYGAALVALALWLGRFDIAWRTVRAHGLPRYMALALLLGYAWLALAGLAWIGLAAGLPTRDAALHALGLGFVVSMVMAHAPVILPAIAGVKLRFGAWFYGPLALLHGSLALRLLGPLIDDGWRRGGALLNAIALALFALTVLGSAFAGPRAARR